MGENNSFVNLSDSELSVVAGGVGGGGSVIAAGSFASNSGTQLNILVSWSIQSDIPGVNNLAVDVSASSYSLMSGASGVELTVNGMTYAATSSPVSYSGNSMAVNHLASFYVPNVSGFLNIRAVWHFNGTYSGVPVGDLYAEGSIAI